MADEPRRAILYAAKSTEDVRGSIPTQLEDGRAMAEREGWEVVGEYADEAASAWSGNRGPQLTTAMDHAERIAPAVLVVQHSDRLARGDARQAQHLVEVVLWGVKAGVTIRSVQDDLFADERVALLMGAMMGQRNTEDSRRKSEAVKSGHRRRAERGRHNGGRPPYGYRHGEAGLLVPVREQAEIVRRIFSEFTAGRPLTAIARDLHRESVPTQRKGSKWRQSTVKGIVSNPTYAGKLRHNGEILPGQHEALIDDATWERASALLTTRTTRQGRPPKGRHLFRGGLLRCGQCGEAMIPRTRPDWEYYYCNGRSKFGREFCDGPNIGRKVIDIAVYSYFESVGLDVEATRQQLAESRDAKLAEVRALLGQAEREARAAGEALARVRRDYQRGAIEADDWAEQRPQLTEEHEAAKAEVGRLTEHVAEVESWGELRDVEGDALRKLADLRKAIAGEVRNAEGIDAVRAALSRLFEEFVVRRGVLAATERAMFTDHDGFPLRQEAEHAPLRDGGCEFAAEGQYVIEARPRPDVLEGYDEELRPVLRREPLGQAENKQRIPSPLR